MHRVLACLLLAAAVHGQTLDRILRDFSNPPKSARPWVRWWLPGGDIDADELRREIAAMDEAGFGGAEIQAFRVGLNPDMTDATLARVNDYPTRSFYGKIRAALEEAKSRGMRIDLTLGSGWPFGGGEAITPELASIELRSMHRTVKGPTMFREKLQLPPAAITLSSKLSTLTGVSPLLPKDWYARMAARTRVVAVVAVKGSEPTAKASGMLDQKSAIVLTKLLQPDGTLEWDAPEGDWQLFLFEQLPVDARVVGAAGAGPQLIMDHMNRAALEAHLNRIMGPALLEIGSHFGATLRAAFCDSLEVQAELYWSDGFLDEFRKRRGYDLTPFLPILKIPGYGDPYVYYDSQPNFDSQGAEKARRDYWRTVSDLWMENFFAPMIDWVHQHRVLARVQAHGAPVDVLRAYGMADIPETEQLYAGGRMEFLKAASSAAHIYGRKIVAAESFVHRNQAYGTTAITLERDVNKLIAAGVNQIIYHGFPYVYMDRPEPGWYPFSLPLAFSDHFNPHAKIWKELPGINEYIGRLQSISQSAHAVMRYAIYHPQLVFPNAVEGEEIPTRDYDYINDDALSRAKVVNGKLVTTGGADYETLVLPAEDAALRKRFSGVKILVGTPPADDAPMRWHLANSEFLFYYNATLKDREYSLPAGKFEQWDLNTGFVTPPSGERFLLTTGAAQLYRNLAFIPSRP
jgi:hypothetical protein